jgi:hypothetical protein
MQQREGGKNRLKIPGGYILQPRKIDESQIMHEAPCTREVWFYILRKVNHTDNVNIQRGQGFFRYADIMDDLCWYAGYCKKTYSKTQVAKSLRRLREGSMIATTKTTRGVLISVLNYSFYQDPENYEGNNEGNTKATRRQQGDPTINKNVKNEKKKDKYSCAFAAFWEAYPKKKAKADAWKAWQQKKGEIPDNIIEVVELNKSSNKDWIKDGGQFIPLPASWIRGARWEDEITNTSTVKKVPDWY